MVGIDGEFFPVDLSFLDPSIRVVQWAGNSGHIEWVDGSFPTDIISISAFQGAITNWQAAKNAFVAAQIVPVKSKEEIQAEMWEKIKAERDDRKSGGFGVDIDGTIKWFHSDVDSRIQHLGLKDQARDLLAAGGVMTDNIIILGQTVSWKTMDGSWVPLTLQIVFDIVGTAGILDARLSLAGETHRALMMASTVPAAYDYSTGWPVRFGL